MIIALSARRLIIVLAAAFLLTAGIAVVSNGQHLAGAISAPPADAPVFSQLATTGVDSIPAAARRALAAAGAPADAPTTVADRGDYSVVVIRGQNTYLALFNKTTERASIVQTPPGELAKQAGTWVAAGGSVDGRRTTLAMLVPDGVGSVDSADGNGVTSRTSVAGNIVVIQREDLSSAEYDFGGTLRRVDLEPRTKP